MITQLRYTIALPYVEHLMAVKNKVEIEGLKKAHIQDAVAFVSLKFYWSTHNYNDNFIGPISCLARKQVTGRI